MNMEVLSEHFAGIVIPVMQFMQALFVLALGSAFIAVVMLPPDRPILRASSGGNFCSKQRIDGLEDASRASYMTKLLRRPKSGSFGP